MLSSSLYGSARTWVGCACRRVVPTNRQGGCTSLCCRFEAQEAGKRGAEVQTLRLDMQVGAALLPVLPGHRGLTLLPLSHGPPV